jgi:hypothetical protein
LLISAAGVRFPRAVREPPAGVSRIRSNQQSAKINSEL